MPVNFWLPRAYTASPSAFIPVLAGVTLNLGLYGILRLNGDLAPGHGIGMGLFALVGGSITQIVGILYATVENDLETMLAHSSIENAGIIVAGIGAFLVFRSFRQYGSCSSCSHRRPLSCGESLRIQNVALPGSRPH